MGGDAGGEIDDSMLPFVYEIDYVRVYQKITVSALLRRRPEGVTGCLREEQPVKGTVLPWIDSVLWVYNTVFHSPTRVAYILLDNYRGKSLIARRCQISAGASWSLVGLRHRKPCKKEGLGLVKDP